MGLQNFEIGERIKNLRESKGLNQNEVCKKVGVSAPTWHKIENGQTVLKLSVASQVAKLFEVSLDYLVEGKEETKEPTNDLMVFDSDLVQKFFISSIQRENSHDEMKKDIEEIKQFIKKLKQ